jgi:hypothetical protein
MWCTYMYMLSSYYGIYVMQKKVDRLCGLVVRVATDSRRYLIFRVVGLERGPLSLVSITEELLEKKKKKSGSGLESREYGRRDPSRWPRGTFYPQKLALSSPTSGGRSV